MKHHTKTKKQLIAELEQLQQRVAELEAEKIQHAVPEPTAAAAAEVSVNRHQLVQEHEELLAQTIRTAKTNICCVDVTTGTFIASPQALALHGFTPETPLTHAAAMAAIYPDDRPRVEAAWKRCVEQGNLYLVEYRIAKEDGTVRWIAAQGQLLPGLRGAKLWAMSQDITERKQMEAALRQSESRYRKLVHHANSAIIRWNRDGTITFINEYAQAFFGYNADEIIGKHGSIIVPERESTGGDLSQLFENVVNNPEGYVRIINENICRDGRRVWMAWTNTPILDENGQVVEVLAVATDITERVRMEEKLRQSEARAQHRLAELEALLEAVPALIWMTRDPEGKVMSGNRALYELVGVPPGSNVSKAALDQTDSLHFKALKDGIEVPLQELPIQLAARGKEVRDYELEFRFDDGRSCFVLGNATPLRDTDGTSSGAVSAFIDITERKEAEAQLRASEQKYRSLFETMGEGFAVAEIIRDAQGRPCDYRVLEVNSAFTKLTGIPSGVAVGRILSELAPAAGADWMDAVDAVALTGEPRRFQNYAQALEKWFEVFAFCPEPSRIAALFVDITERKAAEQAIQESEWKYRTLFETIAQGVVYRNSAGEVTSANSAAERIIGISLEAMKERLSTDPRWTPIREDGTRFSPDEYPPMRALRTGESVKNVVLGWFNRKENDYRWAVVDSIPQIRPGEETPSGVFTVFSDITELKRSKEALRHANERLEHRVQERTSALAKSEDQLRQLSSQLLQAQENERKRVANEIHDNAGQVLAAIKYRVETAYLQLQKAGAGETLQPVQDLIPVVKVCINDMRRLQMELRPSILDEMGIVAAIEWFCREFQTTYPSITVERALAVNESELPESLKLVIFRIVQEALNNIGKHSDARLAHILLEQTEDEVVTLRIEDNGRGFDLKEALQVKAFGKGLGLSSMRERAQYSGGTLSIESAPGNGTRVEARWPIQALK